MLKLSKSVEYSLIAVKHIASNNNGHYATAKEIAEQHSIPAELVAKILQRLTKSQIIVSVKGVKGGYYLKKNPLEITLNDIICSVDNDPALTKCMTPKGCDRSGECLIKDPLHEVQRSIDKILIDTKLSDLM